MPFSPSRRLLCICLAIACSAAAPAAPDAASAAPVRVADADGKVVGRYVIVNTALGEEVHGGNSLSQAALAEMDGGLVAILIGPVAGKPGLAWHPDAGWTLYFNNVVNADCDTGDAYLDAAAYQGNGTRAAYLRISDQPGHAPLLYVARSIRAVARGDGTGWIWRWSGSGAYCSLANGGQGGQDLVYPMGKPHDLSLIWRLPLHLE